jgi:hypothetical protein
MEEGIKGKLDDYDFVEVVSSNEHWNDYLLEDGSVIRVKVVVSNIKKHKTLTDEEGIPRYVLRNQLILDVRQKKEA